MFVGIPRAVRPAAILSRDIRWDRIGVLADDGLRDVVFDQGGAAGCQVEAIADSADPLAVGSLDGRGSGDLVL